MRAAVMQGLHKPLVVKNIPDPTPGPGELVIRVRRCGICGSDLHMTEDATYGMGKGDVLGHEFAGEVVELGSVLKSNVHGVQIGDHVAVIPLRGCGRCASCAAGEFAWCNEFSLQGGGYAEYAVTRPSQCVYLPRSASVADGAIVEPLAVALHGINMSGIKHGDKVLIIGSGPIGLAVAFWARRAGASSIVVQDLTMLRKDIALAMGATRFATDPADPACFGADIVFECVGVPGLIAQAVGQVRNRGTILLLGLCTRPDTFNSFAMLSKEVRLITSAFFTLEEFEFALDALGAGAPEPRYMVSQTIPLSIAPEIFETLRTPTYRCKVLIAP